MYKSRNYKYSTPTYFLKTANYDEFYDIILQKVRNNWNRYGNQILGLSDSKVSRIFNSKQKDVETLFKMAALMQIKLEFKIKSIPNCFYD